VRVEGVQVAVPVRGAQRAQDDVALLYGGAADLHPLLGEPRERHLHDGEVAQQLVDERVDRLVALADRRAALRLLHEHDRAEREHAGRRLEAAGEQTVGEARELVVGEAVTVLAHEPAEQPVTGLLALVLHDLQQVLHGLGDRAEGAGDPAEQVEAGGGQALELRTVGVGDAEQLADRERRDRQCEALYEVDGLSRRGRRRHLVQLAGHDHLDPRPEPAQPVPGELRGEELAQPGVVGRVGEPETARVLVGGDPDGADEVGEVVAEGRRRCEHRLGLLVAGDQPRPQPEGELHPADRLGGAQPPELGHRVEPVALQRDQRRLGQHRQQRVAAATAPPAQPQPGERADDASAGPPHAPGLYADRRPG
jgi:hypothetical protein